MVFTGLTLIVLPDKLPGLQEYVVAPVAVRIALPPLHNEVSFETVIGVGVVTCTVTESVVVHPIEFVAVTVYVVVTVGLAVGLDVFAPTNDPEGNQL